MKGIDISSNNHQGEVFNFAQVKAQGYDFCYVKATQGIHYLNPYLVADVRDAANNGLFVGVYHFFDAHSGTPEEQADFFLRNGIHAPVGEGATNLEEFLALTPVFDYEDGTPGPADRTVERFNAALVIPCGLYLDRDFYKQLGGWRNAKFGWLAFPDWSTEQLPSDTAIVQTGQTQVQGIGESPQGAHALTDNDVCFDIMKIVRIETPTNKKEEEVMDSIEVTINGAPHLVSHVYTSNGHYLEVTRPLANVGKGATQGDSVIDLTDAYPSVTWH